MNYVNAIDTVYKDIVTHIDTIMENNLPVFNTRAIFNNQIKRAKTGGGYSFWDPSVFIQINTHNENTIGDQLTYADLEIIFHISMFQLNGYTSLSLDENLYIFQLRNKIKAEFSMFKCNQTGVFVWNWEEQQFDHDQIYTYKLSYKCAYVDQVANPLVTGDEYYYYDANLDLQASFTASII